MIGGPFETGIVLLLFLLLFGHRKIPDLGRNLGEAVGIIRSDDGRD